MKANLENENTIVNKRYNEFVYQKQYTKILAKVKFVNVEKGDQIILN